MFEKLLFGYEEETIFPWKVKFSHSYMANEVQNKKQKTVWGKPKQNQSKAVDEISTPVLKDC